jgi:hypothetical protein
MFGISLVHPYVFDVAQFVGVAYPAAAQQSQQQITAKLASAPLIDNIGYALLVMSAVSSCGSDVVDVRDVVDEAVDALRPVVDRRIKDH